MPIYEFYCEKNHTVYQFFAKSLAQASVVPPCPDNPKYPMKRMMSAFSVSKAGTEPAAAPGDTGEPSEAALQAMEREFSGIDEKDPKAMGRAMRRMAELSGEPLDGAMEETVRKLEEGADPESLEGDLGDTQEGPLRAPAKNTRGRSPAPPIRIRRDPNLYDYPAT